MSLSCQNGSLRMLKYEKAMRALGNTFVISPCRPNIPSRQFVNAITPVFLHTRLPWTVGSVDGFLQCVVNLCGFEIVN